MTIDSPIITGSIQSPLNLTGNISASGAITGSGFFTTGSIVVMGNITASSARFSNIITAQTLVVQVVSSSTEYASGSNIFGNLATNTHQFTGSVLVSGSGTFVSSVTAGDLISTSYGTARIQVTSTTNSANSGLRHGAKDSAGTTKNAGVYYVAGTTTATTFLSFSSDDNTYQFNVLANGNVGIGTTSPTSISSFNKILHIDGGANNSCLSLSGNSLAGQANIGYDNSILYIDSIGAATGANNTITFNTTSVNSSTTRIERMRITSGGVMRLNSQATYASLTYEQTIQYATSVAGIWFGNSFNSNNNVALQLRTSNDGTSVQALTLASTGAATFSSSVTATGYIFTGTGAVLQSSGPVGTSSQYGLFYNSGGVFYFGKDDSTGGSFGVGAYASILWNSAGYPIVFATTNTERMRITSGGNVLINKTTNSARLSGATVEAQGTFYSGGNQGGFFFEDRANSTYWFGWYSTGNTSYFYNGNSASNIANIASSTGVYTATSDVNKKKDFELSTIGLNAILGLKPTLYRMKNEDETTSKHLGLIAQEVKDYIPQAYVEQDDFIGLQDRPIIAALVKALQELNQKFEDYKLTHP